MKVLIPYAISDATLVSSTVAENDYSAWASGTTYASGSRVIRATTHRIYERILAGSGTATPETDPINWSDIGPTNRWGMLDGAAGTFTSASTSITVQLALGAVNDIALLGVTGTSVTVTRPGGTTAVAAVPAAAVPADGSTVLVRGLGGAAGTYQVQVTGSGTVKVGHLAAGAFAYLGDTLHGGTAGVTDYSRIEFDEFGVLNITRRGKSRRLQFSLDMPLSSLDGVVAAVASVRSMPLVWSGDDTKSSTVVFGLAERFEASKKSLRAQAKLTLRGLVSST